jgi:hypothetical protein
VFNDRSEEEIDAELEFEFNEEEPGDEEYKDVLASEEG